jgi:hypothetical protein
MFYAVDRNRDRCMTFVPESEFLHLMHEIHADFPSLDVKSVEEYEELSLLFVFPAPFKLRYLGASSSKEDFRGLFEDIQMDLPFMYSPGQPTLKEPDEVEMEMYEVFWNELMAIEPKILSKTKKGSAKTIAQEISLKVSDSHLKRAQKYLGLRCEFICRHAIQPFTCTPNLRCQANTLHYTLRSAPTVGFSKEPRP